MSITPIFLSDVDSLEGEVGGNTDLEKFKQVLDNQAESGVRSGDWKECAYEVVELDRHTDIKIPSVEVAFRFRTNTGRFVGIVNWKE